MKVQCHEGAIFVIDDLLGIDAFKRLRRFAVTQPLSFEQRTMGWDCGIIRSSRPIHISSAYRGELPTELRKLERSIASLRLEGIEPWAQDAATLLIYEGECGSYVPLHRDGHVTLAFTYYLNETWDPSWGGELMWSPHAASVDAGSWISPKPDRLVVIAGGVLHKTSAVSPDADRRLTIQGFVVPRGAVPGGSHGA